MKKVQSPMQKALKAYMRIEGVTARGMGASLGIDHTAISRFVNGDNISLDNYNKLLIWFIQKSNNPSSLEKS